MNILNIYPNHRICLKLEDISQHMYYLDKSYINFFQFIHVKSLQPFKCQSRYGLTTLGPYFQNNDFAYDNTHLFITDKQFIAENDFNKGKQYYQYLFEIMPNIFINFNFVMNYQSQDDCNYNTAFFIVVNEDHNNYEIPFLSFNLPLNEKELNFMLPKFFHSITQEVINNCMRLQYILGAKMTLLHLQ